MANVFVLIESSKDVEYENSLKKLRLFKFFKIKKTLNRKFQAA